MFAIESESEDARQFGFDVLQLPFQPTDWVDADERMFHACFAILGQFVEDELGSEEKIRSEEDDVEDLSFYRGYRLHCVGGSNEKAIDLWLWYKHDLPALKQAYSNDIVEAFSGKMKTEPVPGQPLVRIVDFGKVREPKFPYDHDENVKAQKLSDLIELRRTLWT